MSQDDQSDDPVEAIDWEQAWTDAQAMLATMPSREEMDRFFTGDVIPVLVTAEHPPEAGTWDRYGHPEGDALGTADWVAVRNRWMKRAVPDRRPLREWMDGDGAAASLFTEWKRDELLEAALLPRTSSDPTLRPGDAISVRRLAATALFEHASNVAMRNLDRSAFAESAGCPLELYDGLLFHLPGDIAAALAASEPPDAELLARIRLPFPSILVVFSEPIGVVTGTDDDDDTNWIVIRPDGEHTGGHGSQALAGLHLTAGPDGLGLDPLVTWIVGADGGYTALPGLWDRSAWPDVVANTAALLTWARWNQPPFDPPQLVGDRDSRPWRRSLRKSAVRRAVTRGAVSGVRTLYLDDQPSSATDEDLDQREPVGARQAPIKHWRRGHWKRVRLARRDESGAIVGSTAGMEGQDWRYEGRWIPPVVVNAAGKPDPGGKVYKTSEYPQRLRPTVDQE